MTHTSHPFDDLKRFFPILFVLCWTLCGVGVEARPHASSTPAMEAAGGRTLEQARERFYSALDDGADRWVEGLGLELWVDHWSTASGPRRVSTAYRFCAGDRRALMFRANQPLYVMGVGRDGASWRLLGPQTVRAHPIPAQRPVQVHAPGLDQIVPEAAERGEIYLLVSRRPFDLGRFFEPETANLRLVSGAEPTDLELPRWLDRRAAASSFTRAVGGEIESYAFSTAPGRVAAIRVELEHAACSRRASLQRIEHPFGNPVPSSASDPIDPQE